MKIYKLSPKADTDFDNLLISTPYEFVQIAEININETFDSNTFRSYIMLSDQITGKIAFITNDRLYMLIGGNNESDWQIRSISLNQLL